MAPAPPAVATSGVSRTLTDAAITATVKTALLADPLSSGLKIDVDTASAVVKISGTVATPDEKARAEEGREEHDRASARSSTI